MKNAVEYSRTMIILNVKKYETVNFFTIDTIIVNEKSYHQTDGHILWKIIGSRSWSKIKALR